MKTRSFLTLTGVAWLLAGIAACSSTTDAPPPTLPASDAPTADVPTHRAAILHLHPDGDGDESGNCNATTTNMTNTGPGPVMHDARYHLIYWLPSGVDFTVGGSSQEDTYYEAYLEEFLADVSSAPLFSVLSQYTDTSGAPGALQDGGTWTYTTPYPNGRGTTANPLRDSDIQNAIIASLGSGGPGWTASDDDVFFVFTGADVQSCLSSDNSVCTFAATLPDGGSNSQYGAYHSTFSHGGANVIYANMPSAASIGYYTGAAAYPNDPHVDPTITAMSHELFESITDPLLDSWKGPNGNCDEIGDKCNLYMGPAVNLDGSNIVMPNGHRWVAQEEWSNALTACTMGVAPPPAPGCTPSSTCSQEYFPAGYGSPTGYHTLETVSVSCPAPPSILEQSVDGLWTALVPFQPNAGYSTTLGDVFDIGTQSATGQTTSGAAVGSYQQVRACTVTAAGTSCDPVTDVQIADCCVPLTPSACGSTCGTTISDGCGGTVQCPACPPCVPTTCEAAGATCGTIDSCGETLECGTCTAPDACSNSTCCPEGQVGSNGHCCPTGESWNGKACATPIKVPNPPPPKCGGSLPC